MPPTSSAATPTSASVEKRPMVAASRGVRRSGASARVAAGRATTSAAMPPTHALAPSTWRTLAGSSTPTGSWTPACPPRPGSSASRPSGTAASSGRRASASAPTTTHAIAPAAQTVPKRVSSTSTADPSADQSVLPCAVAALEADRDDGARHARDGGDQQQRPGPRVERRGGRRRLAPAARSAGRQASSRTASRPRPSAIAPYWTPRASDEGDGVTGPAFWSPSSSATPAAGGAPSSPTAKTSRR